MYDVQFFVDYFEQRESITEPDLTNFVYDLKIYQEDQDKDKLSSEELLTAYKEFKEKYDQIQEFEVVLADYQIDKVVKEGLFIKMN